MILADTSASLDRLGPARPGRVRRRLVGLADAQGPRQSGWLRRRVRLGLRATGFRRRPKTSMHCEIPRPARPRSAGPISTKPFRRPSPTRGRKRGSFTSATASRPAATPIPWPSPTGLRRLYAGKQGTCYAVSVGSSYEAAALRAIASCGGGSVRQITGDRGPRATARELLSEMARPAAQRPEARVPRAPGGAGVSGGVAQSAGRRPADHSRPLPAPPAKTSRAR